MRCMRKTTDKNVGDEEASSSEDDKDSSRLENLHSCTHCVITVTVKLEECKCCFQYCSLLGDKLKDVKCITMNEKYSLSQQNCFQSISYSRQEI